MYGTDAGRTRYHAFNAGISHLSVSFHPPHPHSRLHVLCFPPYRPKSLHADAGNTWPLSTRRRRRLRHHPHTPLPGVRILAAHKRDRGCHSLRRHPSTCISLHAPKRNGLSNSSHQSDCSTTAAFMPVPGHASVQYSSSSMTMSYQAAMPIRLSYLIVRSLSVIRVAIPLPVGLHTEAITHSLAFRSSSPVS